MKLNVVLGLVFVWNSHMLLKLNFFFAKRIINKNKYYVMYYKIDLKYYYYFCMYFNIYYCLLKNKN